MDKMENTQRKTETKKSNKFNSRNQPSINSKSIKCLKCVYNISNDGLNSSEENLFGEYIKKKSVHIIIVQY